MWRYFDGCLTLSSQAVGARQGQPADAWNALPGAQADMLERVHAAAILLYGSMAGYALLAVIAGFFAIGRRPLPGWFWIVSLVAVILVVIQAAVGTVLFLGGARPRRSLHLLYGLLILAACFIQYGLRPSGSLRRAFAGELTRGEARTLALVSLTQAALIARAVMTGLAVQ